MLPRARREPATHRIWTRRIHEVYARKERRSGLRLQQQRGAIACRTGHWRRPVTCSIWICGKATRHTSYGSQDVLPGMIKRSGAKSTFGRSRSVKPTVATMTARWPCRSRAARRVEFFIVAKMHTNGGIFGPCIRSLQAHRNHFSRKLRFIRGGRSESVGATGGVNRNVRKITIERRPKSRFKGQARDSVDGRTALTVAVSLYRFVIKRTQIIDKDDKQLEPGRWHEWSHAYWILVTPPSTLSHTAVLRIAQVARQPGESDQGSCPSSKGWRDRRRGPRPPG